MSIIREFSDFSGETKHFSGKNGALRWSILVGKQKHNVQKPISGSGWPPLISYPDLTLFYTEKWAVGDLGTRLDRPILKVWIRQWNMGKNIGLPSWKL